MTIFQIIFYFYLFVITAYAIAATYLSLSAYKTPTVKGGYTPKTLVMIPCRGMDLTLEQNLESIKGQDYKNYDIIAIVDSENDKAVPFIKKAGIKHIITSRKFARGSGKVNALATGLDKFKDYGAYVIADSDIQVKSDWLSKLVAPLGQREYGLSTSFPYFKPVDNKVWSKVKMVWGFVGQGMMESKSLRFGWGGSLAFRKKLVADKKSFDYFSSSLSDDIAITELVAQKGLLPFYVPSARPIVNTSEDRASFFEWANRQTALSIRGSPKNFWLGMLSYSLNILLLVSAIVLGIFYSYFAFLLIIPFIVGTIKSYGRLKDECNEFLLINAIMPAMFIINLLVAKNMKNIQWRGRSYDL